jgi:uncharacterized membrane protein YkoI
MVELAKKISWLVSSIMLMCYPISDFAEIQQAISESATEITAEDAKLTVQKEHPGTILRIWRKGYHGRGAYYVRVLSPNGKVQTYIVDAQTAAIIK